MTSRRSIGLGDSEPRLLREGVPPGKLPESVTDKEIDKLPTDPAKVAPPEDPENPGFYRRRQEPYHNSHDIPIVIQDKAIDPDTGQICREKDFAADAVVVTREPPAIPRGGQLTQHYHEIDADEQRGLRATRRSWGPTPSSACGSGLGPGPDLSCSTATK